MLVRMCDGKSCDARAVYSLVAGPPIVNIADACEDCLSEHVLKFFTGNPDAESLEIAYLTESQRVIPTVSRNG